jgi:predicted RNase H-like nuclease
VFFAPVREVIEAFPYERANTLAKELMGLGLSQQSYALRPKILDVEGWLPSAPCPVWEIHPEVSFAVLLGHPARAPKKSWAGMLERRAALVAAGIDLEGVDDPSASRAAVDDMLDAGVAAWSAGRLLEGQARSFPDQPTVHPDGRIVAIWA